MSKAIAAVMEYTPESSYVNAVHLVTQSKGGVGKSFVAKLMAEFIVSTGRTPVCFDADPANRTFTKISQLGVNPVNLLENGDIKRRNFDHLLQQITSQEGPFVVDTGSSSFYALWDYIVQNEMFELLAEEYDRPVIIHVPIAPPPDLEDTLQGFKDICALAPPQSVVAWLNERAESILIEGGSFASWDGAKQNSDKLLDIILVKRRSAEMYGEDVRRMLKAGWTFDEAIFREETGAKDRLKRMRRDIFSQLQEIGI